MDVTDWHDEVKRKFKTYASQKAIEHILSIVVDSPIDEVSSRVKSIETDGGTVIAWKHGGTIDHFFSPDQAEIKKRGVERWPRGMTVRYDRMCTIMDAELNDSDARRETALSSLLFDGPIAKQRRKEEARKRNRKTVRRKKIRYR